MLLLPANSIHIISPKCLPSYMLPFNPSIMVVFFILFLEFIVKPENVLSSHFLVIMSELFIELYSEEIPAKLQIDAREKIKQNLEEKLNFGRWDSTYR